MKMLTLMFTFMLIGVHDYINVHIHVHVHIEIHIDVDVHIHVDVHVRISLTFSFRSILTFITLHEILNITIYYI